MNTKIFINLPVKDLEKSKQFFTAIGCTINSQFTDDTAASIVFSDSVYLMLLTYDKFKQFTKKEIIDPSQSIEVINALSADSKEEVDMLFNKALAAGAKQSRDTEDHGFMYGRSFEDPDGHCWEIFWMDPDFLKPE